MRLSQNQASHLTAAILTSLPILAAIFLVWASREPQQPEKVLSKTAAIPVAPVSHEKTAKELGKD